VASTKLKEIAPEFGPLPAEPGTYALVLSCSVRRRIRIGQLGTMQLQLGYYIYVGSALGPGGLRARIARHLRRYKRTHWHIDYLRAHARLDEVWYWCGASRREHHLARALEKTPGVSVPLPGFGASDCSCASHLHFFRRRPLPRRLGMRWHAAAFR
jgi:Uri superfamily endonuclease